MSVFRTILSDFYRRFFKRSFVFSVWFMMEELTAGRANRGICLNIHGIVCLVTRLFFEWWERVRKPTGCVSVKIERNLFNLVLLDADI